MLRFESYAQVFEDMVLYCALKDVDKGFYIDVGANDPTIDSVTKFFYDRGWHGINIEPLPERCALLAEMRPRDINLCIGLGKEHGKMDLYDRDGMSTFSAEEVARQKLPESIKKTRSIWTLYEVCNKYPPPHRIRYTLLQN